MPLSPRAIPLCIVAAIGRNGAIGRDKAMPWSIPSDLHRFRTVTLGKPMIMGRRTFEAIGRVLPGRETILVTHTAAGAPAGVWIAASADEAVALATERAHAMGADEIVLAGGATLFKSLMPVTERMRLTFVDLAPAADTFFPPIDPAAWRETGRLSVPRKADDEASCTFVDYCRAGSVFQADGMS